MFYKYLAGILQMKLKHLVSLDESPSINISDCLNLETWTLYSDFVQDFVSQMSFLSLISPPPLTFHYIPFQYYYQALKEWIPAANAV